MFIFLLPHHIEYLIITIPGAPFPEDPLGYEPPPPPPVLVVPFPPAPAPPPPDPPDPCLFVPDG